MNLNWIRVDLNPTDCYLYKKRGSWAWWYMSVIPAFRRLRQEDCEFKASLGYTGGGGGDIEDMGMYAEKARNHGGRDLIQPQAKRLSSPSVPPEPTLW
jgi:hypothetical protein